MKKVRKDSIMQKWNKLFTRKGGKLFWKESRGRKAAGSEAGTNHGDGYKTVRIDGKAVYVHRIIKEMSTGKPMGKREIDHKNKKRSDNRPSNLKPSNRSKNNKNRSTWKRKK